MLVFFILGVFVGLFMSLLFSDFFLVSGAI